MRIPADFLGFDEEWVVDNFAGGGGASTGIEMALGREVNIAVNHDPEAVALHTENHPATRHFCEDVFKVDPAEVTRGAKVGLAWFSPDCKHFSKAKGGKPRSKKIRGLAWVVVKWAATVRPRVIMLENVEEFKTWGPLLDDGKPCPKRKGKTFLAWVARLRNLGYAVEWRELRACDYGAPTIRKRLFLIARCDGKPIVWPEPTHASPAALGGKKPWRTAAECIDWSIPCPSIFDRSKPLAEATLRRIARGIVKFVRDAKKPFIVNVANSKTTGRGPNVWTTDEPLRTATASNGFAVVAPVFTECANASNQRVFDPQEPMRTQCAQVKGGHFALATATLESAVAPVVVKVNHAGGEFRGQAADAPLQTVTQKHGYGIATAHIQKYYGERRDGEGSRATAADEPVHTLSTENRMGIVAATLVQTGYGEREGQAPRVLDVEKPLGTVVGGGVKHGVVSAFLAKHFTEKGGQVHGASLDEPAPTVTAVDHNSVVAVSMMVNTTGHPGAPVDAPLSTIATGGHQGVVAATMFKYYGSAQSCVNIEEPIHTVTTKDRMGIAATYVTKLRGDNIGHPMDEPLHTVTGGGTHFAQVCAFLERYTDGAFCDGIVTIDGEQWRITDIGMRMMEPRELYNAQGFPADYRIEEVTMSSGRDFGANGIGHRRGAGGETTVRRRLPKHAQVRMCGNSVCPPMAEALARANVPELIRRRAAA